MSDKLETEDNTLKLSTIDLKPNTFNLIFNDVNKHDNQVGRFFIKDGKLDFEGDATESAKIFIEELKRMWDER